jgi:hypothetical protein
VQGLADFLEPFGIDLDAARADGTVATQSHFIDLRGLRKGNTPPTDPAGMSEYLKGLGLNVSEEALRNATVVSGGETVQQGSARVSAEPAGASFASAAPTPPASISSESRRERATIVRKRDRGATTGNQRLVEFELEVQPAGKVPYRVQLASLVRESLAGLLIEGSSLNVRVDSTDDLNVTIDWSEN